VRLVDPQACLQRWRDARAEGDAGEASEAYSDLRAWLARGGFEPEWEDDVERACFV